jgi:preprotein translocase subunit SecA
VGLLDKVLRAGEGRAIKELAKIAQQVNKFEAEISLLDDAKRAMKETTNSLRQKMTDKDDIARLICLFKWPGAQVFWSILVETIKSA